VKLLDKLKEIREEEKALLACNFYNFETCRGILMAAANLRQPVILQLTESSIMYMGLKTSVQTARTISDDLGAETWIHLDHCRSVEMINRCLDAGFDSVMIDASEKSFSENVRITSEVVKIAENYNVNVEAELGYIPKPGEPDVEKYTDPGDAGRFVDETNISSLAVAIGTKHGFYRETPRLDLNRLKAIRNITNVFLVLHGGSGLPEDTLQEAVRSGIVKVNIATETKDVFMKSLKDSLLNSDQIDLRKVFPSSINAVQKVIEKKIKIVSFLSEN